MKTLIASVLLTCSLALSSTGFAKSHTGTSSTVSEGVETKFWVVTSINGKIDVNVIKAEKQVSLKVVDQLGNTLASQTIGKGASATRTRFDLSELPDGSYKVILIDGNHQEVKDIELNTQSAETQRVVSLG
jgi:type IV pilus biogenesis protein CpaD/CtpE